MLYTIRHKIQETSFIKFYAEQSSLLQSFRLKLKTSLLSVNSLFKEFHIFIDHNVSINEEVFLCCIKTNHLVLTLSNSSDINSDKVKGKPQSRIVVGIHRERGMFALLRLLISWLRLTCVCTSNKVSNLFPVKKEMVKC